MSAWHCARCCALKGERDFRTWVGVLGGNIPQQCSLCEQSLRHSHMRMCRQRSLFLMAYGLHIALTSNKANVVIVLILVL